MTRGYLWVIFAGKCFNAMEKEKTIEIIAPEGYEVDKEKSSFEKIVFRALPDKGLPGSWEELGMIGGFYVGGRSYAHGPSRLCAAKENRSTWPTLEEAEASIALAQLCQLRDRYNGGWKPDWLDDGRKYVIYFAGEKMNTARMMGIQFVLAFKTEELRDKFMENFSDIIEKAKPLLG